MAGMRDEQHISADDLSAYMDGQVLDEADADRIARHLAQCAKCRADLDQLRAVSRLLGELPEPQLPRSFRLSAEDIARETQPVQFEPWFVRQQSLFRAAAMAAVLLLAIVITIDVYPTGNDVLDETAVMMDEPVEEVAPDSEDVPVSEADEDAPGVMSEEAEQDAVEDRDVVLDDPDEAEPSDSAEALDEAEEAEPSDAGEALEEPDEAPLATDDAQRTLAAQDDESVTLLRVAAGVLAGLAIVLLIVGFVLPRWWRSSANH